MQYLSTRDSESRTSAAKAIITGLAPDGGLYVPEEIQPIDIEALFGESYTRIAQRVLTAFLPEYDPAFLQDAAEAAYIAPFNGNAGRLVTLSDRLHSLELWHGPTAAFKDYALQLLPRLLVQAKALEGENSHTLVLVATSGDTGTAALNGFANVPGTSIACFYPLNGTSQVQQLQMTTQTGDNVAVYAVEGNFDDAQRGVKAAFSDTALRQHLLAKDVRLSSANSINWGRLLPQIVYYISSYLELCKGGLPYGTEVDFCVPTGNFGDIMAGYYAKALGLPVGRLICASNRNNVLTDFLETGTYNANREFYRTSSPSMDILVSSNLERLLYHETGDPACVTGWMQELASEGRYTVGEEILSSIRETFAAGWADEAAVIAGIGRMWNEYHYLCDPHTAVGFQVAAQQDEGRPMVVLSTASPYKFSGKVLAALGEYIPHDEFVALHRLGEATGTRAPLRLASLREQPVRFDRVIPPAQIPAIPLELEI